jgi:hypothetical protein
MARATRANPQWEQGPAMARTRKRLNELPAQALPFGVRDMLQAALAGVETQLGGKLVPHTLAHGDFTRFNIRQRGETFVVFDWEYAQDGANPIADVLHFSLSQPGYINALSMLQVGLTQAARFASQAFDDWSPTSKDLAALAVHLLIDTLLFSAAADGCLEMRSFIVRRYLRLVQAWQSWCR